jgi:hypothetical protein
MGRTRGVARRCAVAGFLADPDDQARQCGDQPATFAAGDPIHARRQHRRQFQPVLSGAGAPSFLGIPPDPADLQCRALSGRTSNWSSSGSWRAASKLRWRATGRSKQAKPIPACDHSRVCRAGHGHDRGRHLANGSAIRVQRPKGSQPSTDSLAWTAPTAPAREHHRDLSRRAGDAERVDSPRRCCCSASRTAPVEIRLVVGAAQHGVWRFGEPGPDFTLSGALASFERFGAKGAGMVGRRHQARRSAGRAGTDRATLGGTDTGQARRSDQSSSMPIAASACWTWNSRRCAADDRRHSGVQQRSTSPPSCRPSHRCPRPARTSPRRSTRASSARSGWICGCRRNRPVSARWRLSNLAAAARVDQGRANFDVGDATAYGGSLIGRIALSEKGMSTAAWRSSFRRARRILASCSTPSA